MKIAVVGGGHNGVRLMELLQQHDFQEIQPEITAVADIDLDAPGMAKARRQGIYTTCNYRDLFKIRDIDLIVELTGDQEVFTDILDLKPRRMRAISSKVVNIFWEIALVAAREKEARKELNEASAMYKMVINDLIQEDVMVIDRDHRIVDMNKNLLEKLGLTHEQVVGKHCYEITHRQNTPCSGLNHPCPLIQTLKTRKPYQTTHVHLDKKDREHYHAISTYPLFEGERITGAIEISRDITKDINVQKTLMQQEKLASIGRLSAGVAHEINNPMTTILTSAMLMQEDLAPDDPLRQELDLIANETLRCRKIVASLLNFSRQSKPDKRMHDLNQLVTECELLTRKQAAFKDIAMEIDLADPLPAIYFDKGQIEQTLINLILNAIEATPRGGRIDVATCYHAQKEYARISISDTGEGIPKEILGKIFDPFFTTKETGTGLGLAIAHGIIEQHGGRLEVDSRKGKGSCFKITLPINKEDVHGLPNT